MPAPLPQAPLGAPAPNWNLPSLPSPGDVWSDVWGWSKERLLDAWYGLKRADMPLLDTILDVQGPFIERFDLPDVQQPPAPPIGYQGTTPQQLHNQQQALADYAALQASGMLDGSRGRLIGWEYSDQPNPSQVWPHGQLVAAALDRALVSGDMEEARKALAGIDRYMRPDGTVDVNILPKNVQHRLWDDNAWIGLDFVQAFRMTGEQKYVDGARQIFDFLVQGQQPNGGILWEEGNASRFQSTAANGPALQLALHLYELTGDEKYRAFADRVEAFLEREVRREDGLYIDGPVDAHGGSHDAVWSYNQGTIIGAKLRRYEIARRAGDIATADRYLADIARMREAILTEFTDERLWSAQNPAFNAILFRNLLHVDAALGTQDPRARDLLQRYLTRAEQQGRQPNGLYGGNGLGRYESGGHTTGTPLIDQAAMVQMHSLLAMSPQQLLAVV